MPWAGTLTTAKVGGKRVLVETYQTGVGFVNFPLYTFSGDQYGPRCSLIAACRRAWPPVLTSSSPGYTGVTGSNIGAVGIPVGLTQVTWKGQPLLHAGL